MQFYTKQHKFYCGIDPHTKKMYVCILWMSLHPSSYTTYHRV